MSEFMSDGWFEIDAPPPPEDEYEFEPPYEDYELEPPYESDDA